VNVIVHPEAQVGREPGRIVVIVQPDLGYWGRIPPATTVCRRIFPVVAIDY